MGTPLNSESSFGLYRFQRLFWGPVARCHRRILILALISLPILHCVKPGVNSGRVTSSLCEQKLRACRSEFRESSRAFNAERGGWLAQDRKYRDRILELERDYSTHCEVQEDTDGPGVSATEEKPSMNIDDRRAHLYSVIDPEGAELGVLYIENTFLEPTEMEVTGRKGDSDAPEYYRADFKFIRSYKSRKDSCWWLAIKADPTYFEESRGYNGFNSPIPVICDSSEIKAKDEISIEIPGSAETVRFPVRVYVYRTRALEGEPEIGSRPGERLAEVTLILYKDDWKSRVQGWLNETYPVVASLFLGGLLAAFGVWFRNLRICPNGMRKFIDFVLDKAGFDPKRLDKD